MFGTERKSVCVGTYHFFVFLCCMECPFCFLYGGVPCIYSLFIVLWNIPFGGRPHLSLLGFVYKRQTIPHIYRRIYRIHSHYYQSKRLDIGDYPLSQQFGRQMRKMKKKCLTKFQRYIARYPWRSNGTENR